MRQTECAVSDCDRQRVSKGLCGKHYQRQLRHGSPFVTLRPGMPGAGSKPIAQPGYVGMHARVRKAYGNPGNWKCIDCDSPALDWSLSPMAASVMTQVVHGRPMEYSVRVEDYDPRCRSHHRKLDQARAIDRCR